MNTLQDTMQFALQNAVFLNDADEHLPETLKPQIVRAREALAQIERDHAEQVTICNRDLLPAARERKLADIRSQTGERVLRETDALVRDVAEREIALRQRLEPAKLAVSDVLAVETRSLLRAIDPVIRAELILEAARVGDSRTLAAVETALPYDKLVSAEVLQKARQIRAHAEHPDLSGVLGAVVRLRADLESAIDNVRRRTGTTVSHVDQLAGGDKA